MRKKIFIALLYSFVFGRAQTPNPSSCFNQQLYTGTTDPNDNSSYNFSSNSFNYNLNPNGINGPTHFDWVNSQTYPIFTALNLTASDYTIKSPFYCYGSTPVDGGCSNKNLRVYNDISSDFTNFQNNYQRLKAMDVLPEDGWELIKYSFGRAKGVSPDQGVAQKTPFVWLYNRYTGKIKFFIAITNYLGVSNQLNSAVIRFSTTPSGQYDLFANAKPFTHILSDFTHGTTDNASMSCDIQPVGTPAGSFSYYWLYSEFSTSYDPCVCRQASNNASLNFDIFTLNSANVQLELDGTANPINIFNGSGLYSDGASVNSSSINDNASLTFGSQLIGGAKAAIKGYKDWKEYSDKIKDYFNSKTSNGTTPSNDPQIINIVNSVSTLVGQNGASAQVRTQATYYYLNGSYHATYNPTPKTTSEAVQFLTGLAPLVEDLASVAPYIGAFISLTNFLIDAGSNESTNQPTVQPAAPPTSYALNAKITGNITYGSNVTNGYVYIPGLKINNNFGSNANADNNYPIYNNPLGVFNIVSVPDFEYKTITLANGGVDNNDPNTQYGYYDKTSFDGKLQDPTYPSTNRRYPFSDIYDYKLQGPVKYALNPAANLTVKSIDACFILEYEGTDAFYPLHDNIPWHDPSANNGNGGFNGYMRGNSIVQTQFPYYPGMSSYYDPNDPVTYPVPQHGTNLSTALTNIKSTGFEIESQTSNFTNSDGNNPSDARLRLRTPYVSLQSLDAIDFILLGTQSKKPKIYLKLFCKFSKNGKPNDEPVTFIMTYDISNKLNNATSSGSGGIANFNYFYLKDKSNPYAKQKPADYATFSNLYVYGAHFTPNYGVSGGTWNGNSGLNATSNVNIASGTYGTGWATNTWNVISTMGDINVGNNVTLTGPGSQTNLDLRALNDINIGGNCTIHPFRDFYAGNNITISPGFNIGNGNQTGPRFFSSNTISLFGATGVPSQINTASFYAAKEISLTTGWSDITISGESTLSSGASNLIPIWAVLNNWIYNVPVSNFQATNTELVNICSASPINNRAAIIDTTYKQPGKQISFQTKNQEKLTSFLENKIQIFPSPTSGNLNISYSGPTNEDLTVKVEDISGKELLVSEFHAQAGSSQISINLNEFANGIYIVKIQNTNGYLAKSAKIIVQK